MKNMRVAELLFNRPLMISEDKLDAILHALGPRFNIDLSGVSRQDMLEFSDRERRMAGYQVQNGVATIPVHGSLVQRASWMDAESGIMGYQSIRDAFDTALKDDGVSQIVLDVDSPGGEVNGAFDLADHIYQSRGQKPITAMVNERAYSAAYLLASAADRIVVPRTGGVGSVGVIATHADFSRAEDAAGITVTHVYAGARKADLSPHQPLSEEAIARLQESVNETYDMFIETVARNRGLSVKDVRETEAGTFRGKKAVKVRFADEVSAVDKAFSKLVSKGGYTMKKIKEETPVETAEEGSEAVQEQAVEVETPAEEAAVTAPEATAEAEGSKVVADTAKEAAEAERTRILGILEVCHAHGADAMAANLIKEGTSVDASKGLILDAMAARSEAQDVVSRHGGQPAKAQASINTAEIYSNRTAAAQR